MTRATNRLTAVTIRNAPPSKLSDGGGLVLDKTATGGKWLYRYSFAGVRREMGLGAFPDVSLADARKARDRWATTLATGKDPITERKRLLAAEKAAIDRADPTLAEAATMAFQALQAGLKGAGERGRWFSPVKLYLLPKMGAKRLSDIHQSDIAAALRPIWQTKHPTAQKAIQRLGIIYKWARLAGYPCDPFTIEAAAHILGAVAHDPVGIVATDWHDMPALYKRLDHVSMAHMALRMTILTCARTDSVRGMRFSEVAGNVWTVPPDRMKASQPFRYPLPPPALELLDLCRARSDGDYVFASYIQGKSITENALLKALNTLGEAGRPHGFRTSFRTWAQDTGQPWDVAETVLAHKIGGRVERTYARSDMLDRRAALMLRWSEFVTAQGATFVDQRHAKPRAN